MIKLSVGLLCASLLLISSTSTSQEPNRTILAVFAHADDELVISPLLARYEREGAEVHLAIVTRGEKWAPQTDLPPGDGIAELRAEEARCAARALGIRSPILLDFDDGSLGARVRPPWATLKRVEAELRELFLALKPDVIITWGPDGGYGHPEHRLVGGVVTQLVQRKVEGSPQHLLYPGFPLDRVPQPKPGDLPWAPVEVEYLTVQVPYTDADLKSAASSMTCYKSQFPEEALLLGVPQLHQVVWQGRIYLRPWFGSTSGSDLFNLSQ